MRFTADPTYMGPADRAVYETNLQRKGTRMRMKRIRENVVYGLWIALAIGSILVAIAAITIGLQRLVVYSNRTDCNKYRAATGYDAEFVYYGFWSNECIVTMPDGTKIPKDQIRVIP